MPLALSEIDGDADALVAVVLDRFDFAAAHADRLSEAFGDVDLAIARPARAGRGKDVLRQLLQGREGRGETGRVAGDGRTTRHGNGKRGWKAAIIAVHRPPTVSGGPPHVAKDRMNTHAEHDDDFDRPSKTQRKQAMAELQALGEALVELPTERLKKVALPDDLRSAILEAQRMPRQDEAKRRQMQYIGKLMRATDAEPIRAALAEARGDSAAETARLHRLERLRADLLADEKVLHAIAGHHPGVDLQHLRALRRAALKEQEQNKPPRNYRALFQALKALDEAPGQETRGETPEDA